MLYGMGWGGRILLALLRGKQRSEFSHGLQVFNIQTVLRLRIYETLVFLSP